MCSQREDPVGRWGQRPAGPTDQPDPPSGCVGKLLVQKREDESPTEPLRGKTGAAGVRPPEPGLLAKAPRVGLDCPPAPSYFEAMTMSRPNSLAQLLDSYSS